MDLYKYFHPHHHPRLRKVPLRLQEIGELSQAAEELKRAVQRAKLRCETNEGGPILPEHFANVLVGLDYVCESFATLFEAHPGDDVKTILKMVEERRHMPGWETWAAIVSEKLQSVGNKLGNVA